MYACLAVTCHLHFWQNDWDFLHATVVTWVWNGYQNKSQHRKSTLEKKFLPPFQQGFKPATFQSRVRRSNHWAIPAPHLWQITAMQLFILPALWECDGHMFKTGWQITEIQLFVPPALRECDGGHLVQREAPLQLHVMSMKGTKIFIKLQRKSLKPVRLSLGLWIFTYAGLGE